MNRRLLGVGIFAVLAIVLALGFAATCVKAQETTGSMEGTVKDPTGAVVPKAHIVITGTTLVGSKEIDTDSKGYYRFANLPPGTYEATVTAQGFSVLKQGNIVVEVGHVPTVDFSLTLGNTASTVEVTGQAPVIDVTSNQNITNVTTDELNNLPHGTSFQSVIEFAPMARNEPLAGLTANGQGMGGTGGSMPGSSGNGLAFGYQIGGAGDSESSYLVEGQDTEQNSGGYSKANVPYEFIDQVELKTSGIEAEYGGALGGVVNVVMKKGTDAFHGSLFTTFEPNWTDANNNNMFLRYNPLDTGNEASGLDPGSQLYDPSRDNYGIVQPGFTVGGPILKDRLFFFVGFAPQYARTTRAINIPVAFSDEATGSEPGGPNAPGPYTFNQNAWTYYTTARLDAAVTQKIRLYASWLYQYAREQGETLPIADPKPFQLAQGFENTSWEVPVAEFSNNLGWSAPNVTYNTGADITISPKIVSTTRFGYFFENYHDFGWQTSTPNLLWATSGLTPAGTPALDNSGQPLPASLALPGGSSTAPYTPTFTVLNANKHYQLNQDFAFFFSGWGSHNFKVGYQLNHLTNSISQNGNVPEAFLYVGAGTGYSPATQTGGGLCGGAGQPGTLINEWGVCAGQYGYVTVQDFATVLTSPASDWNHALYAQDSWTIGHGLTLNLGLRVEKEDLPAPGGVDVPGIHFNWGDKLAPRLGVAWDPTGTGKMKAFFSYGVVNDVMKLLVAQSSFGAQAFEDCTYPLGPDSSGGFSVSDIDLMFKNGRACPSGPPTLGANFASGSTPSSLIDPGTGIGLIENVNFRPAEPVAPNVKPYRQHEYVAGYDYAISPSLAFEARYDRRRLDHVIEDASLADPDFFELYTIVNPGQGVNRTIDGYANYLTSIGQAYLVPGEAFNADPDNPFGTCPTCPPNPKAIRDYDGLELRLTKTPTHGWGGMFSYTWSRLWGNYTGLTTTDQIDGNATGRNSPDTTRAFDEPFFYFGENGKSNDGPLPTDRPNTFKGYGYYKLPWKGMNTTFGLFQQAYQGSPVSSYIDLGNSFDFIPLEATYIWGRGNWVNATTDDEGNITLGTPYARRTPWYTQTDFNIAHEVKVAEGKSLSFSVNVTNLFNQHAIVNYYEGLNSENFQTPLHPGLIDGQPLTLFDGAATYQALESGYNAQEWINGNGGLVPRVIKSSWYGQPQQWQLLRAMRFGLSFTF